MSRAFTPPDTLSPSDVRTVADVRRTVWISGIFGLGAGATTCALGHVVLQKLQSYYLPEGELPKQLSMIQKILKPLPPLGKNTFTLSLLGGGALGSFVMSTTAGKIIYDVVDCRSTHDPPVSLAFIFFSCSKVLTCVRISFHVR